MPKRSETPKSGQGGRMAEECLVTNEEKNLSLAEKLDLLEKEFCLLHEFCVKAGRSGGEIEQAVSPFLLLTKTRTTRRCKWLRRILQLALFIAVAYALFNYDPVYKILKVYGRKTSIQLLPYWDWTYLYHEDCLIENPYYDAGHLKEEDCEVCESIDIIERVENSNATEIGEKYLNYDRPLIVSGAMTDWPAVHHLTILQLDQLYRNNPVLRNFMVCYFHSNIHKYDNQKVFLRRAASGDLTGYYAYWENCMKPAAKVFREFYKRPSFLPLTAELTFTNWIFVSSGFKGKKYKPVEIDGSLIIIAQVKGDMRVTVHPRDPCKTLCSQLSDTLHEGDILLQTTHFWDLTYLPGEGKENIAIGMAGSYDFF